MEKIIEGVATIFADFNQRETILAQAGIERSSLTIDADSRDIRFESRKDYDFAVLHLPFLKDKSCLPPLVELYISKNLMFIFADADIIELLEKKIKPHDSDADSSLHALSNLFAYILKENASLLEEIGTCIENLEERSTLKDPEDYSAEIISLRKELLSLKHYFEALYDLLEDLEDNENGIFSKTQLRVFRLHKNKANRLLNTALNLGDYLTQVREAFQNQLDINLNDTMRFFTVITAVFLPLTLIVGWYGMNLHMPETAYSITYPIVIIVCVAFIVTSLVFCKKKGWF